MIYKTLEIDSITAGKYHALMLITNGQSEVESFVEEHLYCAEFDSPEEEGCKIEDEDDFLIGIKFIFCMEH